MTRAGGLPPDVAAHLRMQLPVAAANTVAAITAEVPDYADAFSGRMGANIQRAVELALEGFLEEATTPRTGDKAPGAPRRAVMDGAYALGRGEARSGRTMDALLTAYRLGSRVTWRELSTTVVAAGLPAEGVAGFAELLFAFIDELSAVSAAGHTDELASSGRVREQYRAQLARALLAGAPDHELTAAAERAGWEPPEQLVAVLVSSAAARDVLARLTGDTLVTQDVEAAEVAAGTGGDGQRTVLLASGDDRNALLAGLRGRSAVVGPAKPWALVAGSYRRAQRTAGLSDGGLTDSEQHLPELILGADADALADLRRRALAPLDGLGTASAARLAETLRSWLLHQGRRDEVAAELMVHPQTVRYRMNQLRELYGDRLREPAVVLELILALSTPARHGPPPTWQAGR